MRAPGTYPHRLVKPLYSPQSRSLSAVHDLSNICSGNLFWNSELCCDRYQVKTSELGTSVASIPWEDQQILQEDVTRLVFTLVSILKSRTRPHSMMSAMVSASPTRSSLDIDNT